MSPLSLAPLLVRFAAESEAIRHLTSTDAEFRDIVEDFLLAHSTLANLKNQPVVDRAKVVDYADLVNQLEHDVQQQLSRSKREPR